MSDDEAGSRRDRWAQVRFAIVGRLLAAPPARGALRAALEHLTAQTWRHPLTAAPVGFARSTIERWYYAARNARRDPVGALRRHQRKDAGQRRRLAIPLQRALRAQYQAHPRWSYQLHTDNLAVLVAVDTTLGPRPSYATVRRYLASQGLVPQRRLRRPAPAGAADAATRRERFEVRSFEAEYVHGLWHLDFHHGSHKVLTRTGTWARPLLLGVLDDRSRLACHLQWYLEETAEALVHGLAQAIQKRALPRALLTDNGSARPQLSPQVVKELLTCRFIDEHRNVILVGRPSTGKTTVAKAIGHAACSHALSVYYAPTAEVLQSLHAARADGTDRKVFRRVTNSDLLILDDAGFSDLGRDAANELFRVVCARYRQRSTVVVSNLPFRQWAEFLPSPAQAVAIADRLVDDATILRFSGTPYRQPRAVHGAPLDNE